MYDSQKEMEVLKQYVRKVNPEDKKKLPTYSHSRLEVYENCPYKYLLQYMKKKRSKDSALALELGTLCHYIYEIGAQMWLTGDVNYNTLNFVLEYGDTDEHIIGIKDLKKKYFEEWFETDSEGHSYKWKMEKFHESLYEYFNNMNIWRPYKQEYDFEFVFNERAIIQGFIDAILINDNGDLLCQDFKTSKKKFPDNKIPTSQQFSIYCMAILNEFNVLPVQCDYKFILLGETQNALTDGFGKRIVNKLNKIMDKIDNSIKKDIWTPNPTPLCHWCNYSLTNPKAKDYKNECEYYSLWTPTKKDWKVNKKYNALELTFSKDEDNICDNKQKRKLVF